MSGDETGHFSDCDAHFSKTKVGSIIIEKPSKPLLPEKEVASCEDDNNKDSPVILLTKEVANIEHVAEEEEEVKELAGIAEEDTAVIKDVDEAEVKGETLQQQEPQEQEEQRPQEIVEETHPMPDANATDDDDDDDDEVVEIPSVPISPNVEEELSALK